MRAPEERSRRVWRLLAEVEAARDVVQDAWTDIVRGLARLDDTALFPAWAYRIVSRRAADAIRKRSSGRKLGDALARKAPRADDTAARIEAAADRAPLARSLAALPAEQRAASALFYLEDLSVVEIAAATGVPVGMVKTRLMQARTKLRTVLKGEDHQ